jgi:hypothetical protein
MNELLLSITHLRQVCTLPFRNAARSKEALPHRGRGWDGHKRNRARHENATRGDAALDTSALYDGLTSPVWRTGCRQAQLWCRVVLAREIELAIPWHAM